MKDQLMQIDHDWIIEQQYALVYYLQNGNPSELWRQIAETRLKHLEKLKSDSIPINVNNKKSTETNFYLRNNITFG